MSFVSSQYEPPFSSPFDHDLFDKKLSLLPSSSDDLFSDVRQDFSRIFHDNNLDIFANATEFGIPEKPDPISTKFEAPTSKNPVIGHNNNPIIAPQKDIVQSNVLGTGNFLVNSIVPKFQDEFQQPEPKKGIIRKEIIWGIDGFVDSFGDEGLGDMWANDPVKEIKGQQQEQKQAYNNNDIVAYNGYQSFNRKQAIQGQLYMDNYLADILSSMQSLVLGKSSGEVQNVAKGLERKKSLDMDKNPIETSQTKLNKNSVKTESDTVTKKKMSRDSFDEDSPEEAGLEKGRSLKGLRVLSMRVKNIVIQKKKTTYKEVADILVKEVASQSKPGSQPDNKDEQNVKRRVYDALNVLIATGILQKEGKLVTYANNPLISSSSSKMDSGLRNGPLGLTLVNAQRRTQIKAQNLHELLYKTLALKSLIKRNKENSINQPLHQQNAYPSLNFQRINAPSSASSNTETIKFPFLVIDSPTPHNSINLDLDVTQKQLSIESTNALNVSGDIDILLKMNLHNVPRSFFNEHIPKAMHKHVPKSFLENLS